MGDCFGARGAENEARLVRERLKPILTDLVDSGRLTAEPTWPIARAAAYLLTFTAQARHPEEPEDFSEELLKKLAVHKYPVTKELTTWALNFRFAEDGSVRPLLDAARLDADGTSNSTETRVGNPSLRERRRHRRRNGHLERRAVREPVEPYRPAGLVQKASS
ncbi:hypothetical protein AB0D86_46665 [Streptomyces sp. NPDC048324]|uniref:hypothetical protein n=1 Tax=Streptomyces sp. NPDC048324 TaxID=3157205 RepID=UPI0034199955